MMQMHQEINLTWVLTAVLLTILSVMVITITKMKNHFIKINLTYDLSITLETESM